MKEILDKISSYNLFNYLLPGVLFAVFASGFTNFKIIQSDIISSVFLYYFIGLVISRFGSLIIEPLLKKIGFVKFADYKDFVNSCKTDIKVETLSEANNMYRTFISLFFLLGLFKLCLLIEEKFSFLKDYNLILLTVLLLLLFLFSYRKQTNYIIKRINSNKQ